MSSKRELQASYVLLGFIYRKNKDRTEELRCFFAVKYCSMKPKNLRRRFHRFHSGDCSEMSPEEFK